MSVQFFEFFEYDCYNHVTPDFGVEVESIMDAEFIMHDVDRLEYFFLYFMNLVRSCRT